MSIRSAALGAGATVAVVVGGVWAIAAANGAEPAATDTPTPAPTSSWVLVDKESPEPMPTYVRPTAEATPEATVTETPAAPAADPAPAPAWTPQPGVEYGTPDNPLPPPAPQGDPGQSGDLSKGNG